MVMEGLDASTVISEAESEKEQRTKLAKEAIQWFIDNKQIGELYLKEDVVEDLIEHLDVEERTANNVLEYLVGDIVDPVQQVISGDEKYVGIIEYQVYSDEGSYGYVDYDDRRGRRKRVVCAKCVEDEKLDEHITHATQGEGTASEDASWQDLRNKVTAHYANDHETAPEDIEPGASLVSGTTIGGNTSWHDGNVSGSTNISIGSTSVSVSPQGSGSGLNADSVDGQDASQLGGATAQPVPFKVTEFSAPTDTTTTYTFYSAIGSGSVFLAAYAPGTDLGLSIYKNGNYLTSNTLNESRVDTVTTVSTGDTFAIYFINIYTDQRLGIGYIAQPA